MMGHFLRYWSRGTLLFWSVLLLPFLVNVALDVHALPLVVNDSVKDDGFTEAVTTVDDLALSSEELEDEDALLDYNLNPINGKSSLSTPDIQATFLTSQSSNYATLEARRIDKQHHASANDNSDDDDEHSGSEEDNSIKGAIFPKGRYGRSFSSNAPAAFGAQESFTSKYTTGYSSNGRRHVPTAEKLTTNDNPMEVKIIGLSIDYGSDKRRVDYDSEGSPNILEGLEVTLTLYGKFTRDTYFRFSKFNMCNDPKNKEKEHKIKVLDDEMNVGVVHPKLPLSGELSEVYLCLREGNSEISWRQGEIGNGEKYGLPVKPWLVIKLTKAMFPLYLHVLFIVLLLTLSGLFSGLNLGLMSLDKTDLKIIMNTGSKSEKSYASSIAPVRNHGNFLLCCLLFSNVLVNATLTILVDDLTSGLIAIAGSTLSIVIFGEIIPQAICSRYGLAVGARTIYITKFFMFLTSPLAFPLSILLDKILGEEIGNIYTRERLKELLKVTKDHHGLENEEVGIISGALDLKLKSVKDVMVRIEHIFMLPADTILDFDTMAEIEYQGYSRIPVYDGERSNVVSLINVRQLTLLDASDNIPLRTIMDYYKTNLFFVFENTRLDYMFKAFREGSRGHMAFVQRVNDEGPGDPYYETVGMLTMEDVLEEILQADIRDENDVGKLAARSGNTNRPTTVPFAGPKKAKKVVEIPATLALAATQFLSTSVDPFKHGCISVTIIQRLLKTNVQFVKAPKKKARQQAIEVFLYENGKPADCFIMILEGRVQVTVGKEKLTYEAGPFTAFGNDFLMNDQIGLPSRAIISAESALNSPTEIDPNERPSITSEMVDLKRLPTFIPDYSVKVLTDVYFFRMKYDHYRHAIAATDLERTYSNDPEQNSGNQEWQYEIDKVLDTGDDEEDSKEDPKGGGDSNPPSKKDTMTSIEEKQTEKDTSTTTTESDESDNKDSDHDENNPNEETKLLQKLAAYS